MTETPPLCTAWPWDAPLARRTGSHGPPVGRRELRIVDPDDGAAARAGARTARSASAGPSCSPATTGEPRGACLDADGFFHTGDLGRLDDDGALHFVGRLKDVIKTAGANVAAAEVEAVLLEHPAVAAAHAVGVPDAPRGENVAAFVVPEGSVADEATLLAHCRDAAGELQGAAPALAAHASDELPTKGSGKVDKAALRDGGGAPHSRRRPCRRSSRQRSAVSGT